MGEQQSTFSDQSSSNDPSGGVYESFAPGCALGDSLERDEFLNQQYDAARQFLEKAGVLVPLALQAHREISGQERVATDEEAQVIASVESAQFLIEPAFPVIGRTYSPSDMMVAEAHMAKRTLDLMGVSSPLGKRACFIGSGETVPEVMGYAAHVSVTDTRLYQLALSMNVLGFSAQVIGDEAAAKTSYDTAVIVAVEPDARLLNVCGQRQAELAQHGHPFADAARAIDVHAQTAQDFLRDPSGAYSTIVLHRIDPRIVYGESEGAKDTAKALVDSLRSGRLDDVSVDRIIEADSMRSVWAFMTRMKQHLLADGQLIITTGSGNTDEEAQMRYLLMMQIAFGMGHSRQAVRNLLSVRNACGIPVLYQSIHMAAVVRP